MENILPDKIRMRMDKMGFVTPEEISMKENKGVLLDAVENAIENSAGILRRSAKDKIRSILADHEGFSFLPWRMISFGKWMDIYQVDN